MIASGIQHTVTRQYTKVKGTAYSLPHDAEEQRRLTLQSDVFLRATDHKVLHAPVKLTDDDRVLEAATGTGIWLLDLARETSAKPEYIGVDIEPAFFPKAATLPANMRFETQSVTALPSEWTDNFSLVHQRLLIAALRRHEWGTALSEIYRVLKPGGWVQLLEMQGWTSGPALAKHSDLLFRYSDDVGIMYRDIAKRLPDFLGQAGFVNIHQDPRSTPLGVWAGTDGVDGKEVLMGVLEGLKTPILRRGGYGLIESEVEYDQLLEDISKELDNTPGSEASWTMFWAQKPLE